MTYKKIQEILRCAQILRCLKSKYLLFFSARRVFRYVGIDVRHTNVKPPSGNLAERALVSPDRDRGDQSLSSVRTVKGRIHW